jgi:hypothetical protein
MKKETKKTFDATLTSIMEEMAKPRLAKSARPEEVNQIAQGMAPVTTGRCRPQRTKSQTSAASVHLSDHKGEALWSAPE